MCLNDGREGWGGVPEAAQGGVLISPSDTWELRDEVTGIGLEGRNELNFILPPLPKSERSSTLSLLPAGLFTFILLCSSWISRREAEPFVNFAPPHAGPSCFGVGVGGGGATSFGASSRAPLRNIESPPFLLLFFFEAFGDGPLAFNNSKASFFCTTKAKSFPPSSALICSHTASSSTYQKNFRILSNTRNYATKSC